MCGEGFHVSSITKFCEPRSTCEDGRFYNESRECESNYYIREFLLESLSYFIYFYENPQYSNLMINIIEILHSTAKLVQNDQFNYIDDKK